MLYALPARQRTEPYKAKTGLASSFKQEHLSFLSGMASQHTLNGNVSNIISNHAPGSQRPQTLAGLQSAYGNQAVLWTLHTSPVEAERAKDWQDGLVDLKERGGWIMWATGSSRGPDGKMDYTRRDYRVRLGDNDEADPGGPMPSNDSLFFCVGHYHQHMPLLPDKDPKDYPVGPSQKDLESANELNNPGIVRDFTDISRTVVTNYMYGPSRRPPL